MQTSPGTTRFFPSIYLPHLSRMIPCSYWALACVAVLPSCVTFYVVSVRQARGLPAKVNRFPLTSGFLQIPPRDRHLCLRLYPSHYRAGSGLSPVRNVRRRAHNQKGAALRTRQHLIAQTNGYEGLLAVYVIPWAWLSCDYKLI